MSKPFTDIDHDALDALIARVTEAKEHELALSPQDCQLLLDALVTLLTMQQRLASHDVTIHKGSYQIPDCYKISDLISGLSNPFPRKPALLTNSKNPKYRGSFS